MPGSRPPKPVEWEEPVHGDWMKKVCICRLRNVLCG